MTDHPRHPSDDLHELLVPYLLGGFEDGERDRVEAALAEDAALRQEYELLEATGAHLAQSLPTVPAPAALRSRVLDAVAAAAEPHALPAREQAPQRSAVADLGARRARRSWFRTPQLAGFAAGCAAASILFAGLVLGLGLGEDDDPDPGAKTAPSNSSIPAGLGQATFRPVSTRGDLEGANGTLVGIGDNDLVLVLRNLPSPGAGRTWQVWTANDRGDVRNVGSWFGSEETQLLAINSADVTQVMVSHEPSLKRAATPTGDPVALVKV